MKRLLLAVAFVFVSSVSYQLFAQSSSSINTNPLISTTSVLNMNSTDWSFFVDDENHIYYIDFEKINVNLNDIKVMNEEKEVVLEDQLYDLPVNTIYELDLSGFPSGVYEVELRSFTGMTKKQITIL